MRNRKKFIVEMAMLGILFLVVIESVCFLFFKPYKLDTRQFLNEDINIALSEKANVISVSFFLSNVSEEGIDAVAFLVSSLSERQKYVNINLHNGWNHIVFPDSIKNTDIDFVRLDFAEKEGVSSEICNITLNDSMIVFKNGLVVFLLGYSISVLSILITNGAKNVTIHAFSNKVKSCLAEYQFLLMPTFILFGIYLLGCLSIMRANVNYLDDLRRQLDGYNNDWVMYQRYIEYFLSKLFNIGDHLVDLSPFSTIIGCLVTAFAGAILLYVITDKKKYSAINFISMIPLGLSPYYLECLSYKFEAPYYGFAIVFSILPFLFCKKDKLLYMVISIVSLLGMFNTYYATSGVYPMIVLLLALKMWSRKKNLKEITSFIIQSAGSYCLALAIYKVLIMKPVDSWVSSTIPSLDKLIPTIISNYLHYCSCILSEFKAIWLYMIFLCMIGFVFVIIRKSDRNALASAIMSILCLVLMGLLCWGLYPALESTSFTARAMFGFGIYIALITGTVCSDSSINLFKFPVFVLGWCFYVFSFSYGNYLHATQVYNEYRIQNVLNYINDLDYYSDSDNEIFLQIAGDAGRAPIIDRIPAEEKPIFNKLLPASFNGMWVWGQVEFYEYYDLSGFSLEYYYSGKPDLKDLNLPQIDSTMYFDVYGDQNNLLIMLK